MFEYFCTLELLWAYRSEPCFGVQQGQPNIFPDDPIILLFLAGASQTTLPGDFLLLFGKEFGIHWRVWQEKPCQHSRND